MSSNGLEAVTVADWLWDTLTASQDLQDLLGGPVGIQERVAQDTLPFGAELPGIRYTVLPPRDVKVVGMVQVFSSVQFDLVVTAEAQSYGPCIPVYEAAHRLLEGATNAAVPTGQVLTCSRVSGIMYPERDAGIEYRHLGGTYAVEAN